MTSPAQRGKTAEVTEREQGSAEAGAPAQQPNEQRLRDKLDKYMADKGLRSTEQRRLIVDTVFTSGDHATIDDLLAKVRQSDGRVGYATVYRTMKMLADCGVVQERRFGDGFTRYELADSEHHHDHLICLDCGFIQEFEEPLIEDLQDRVAARFGFRLNDHKLELYGHCTKENCPHKKGDSSNRARLKDA